MYVCMYVCMYVYVCVYIYIYICMQLLQPALKPGEEMEKHKRIAFLYLLSTLCGPVVSSTGVHGFVHISYREPFGGKNNKMERHVIDGVGTPDPNPKHLANLCVQT